MKALAFLFGLSISAVGVVGLSEPSVLVWIARRFETAGAFYLIAAVRIAFGFVLISAAPASRLPRALRVLGYAIVTLGIASALGGLLALGQARGAIAWWLRQDSRILRLTAIPIVALGGFVAYATAVNGVGQGAIRPPARGRQR